MAAPDDFDFRDAALSALREEVKQNLLRFSKTKPGQIAQEVGTAVLRARREGRKLTQEEVEALARRIPEILHGGGQ